MHQLPDTPRAQQTRARANVVLIRLASVVFAASAVFAFQCGASVIACCFAAVAGGLIAWSMPVAARVRRDFSPRAETNPNDA